MIVRYHNLMWRKRKKNSIVRIRNWRYKILPIITTNIKDCHQSQLLALVSTPTNLSM